MPGPITVKIAFVLDCTGSMEPWIKEAKTKIHEIVESTLESHASAYVEVALVAYRDYGDEDRHRVVDFTTADEIERVLGTIHADGGDDEAEDVAWALDHVCGLTWGPSDVRIVVHIADAPAHGRQFHKPRLTDRYPEGDPQGNDPLVSIRHLAAQETDVTFVRITSDTDVMIDVFRSAYLRESPIHACLRVIDLHPDTYAGQYGPSPRRREMSQLLSPAVTRTVTESITRHSASRGK